MVSTVRASQGKIRGSGKVGEFKSSMVQKLTEMQRKILNCSTVQNFSACFARRLSVPPL